MIDRSHGRGVQDIHWLPNNVEVNKKSEVSEKLDQKVSNQFITVAGCGLVTFWDIRVNHWKNPNQIAKEENEGKKQFKWLPVCQSALTKQDRSGTVPITKLVLTQGSEFVSVTEDGDVCFVDWVGNKSDGEGGKVTRVDTVHWMTKGHFQACTAIQRSPHQPDMYLTVGDWSFVIWKCGNPTPVFKSPMAESYLTDARWSPSRPGMIVTARADGSIDVWDLLDQGHKASLNFSTGADPITSMEFWQSKVASQQYLAVGDSSGKLHVLDIPRALRRQHPNEVQLMENFYERELQRVDYAGKRREIRKREARTKKPEPMDAVAANKLKEDEEKRAEEKIKKQKEAEEQSEATYQKMLKAFKEELFKDD